MNDQTILDLIAMGRLRVDPEAGLVYAPKSNTPDKPVGAPTKKGYRRLCVNLDGRQNHFMVHRIVWIAAYGVPPSGYEIDHINMDKTDNRIANLEAVPGSVNMRRAVESGASINVGRRDGIRDEKGRFGKKAAGRMLDGRIVRVGPKMLGEWPGLTDAQKKALGA